MQPELPDIPGIRARNFRGKSDFPMMARITNAANETDRIEEVMSADEYANQFAHLANCDPQTDVLFIDAGGQTVAFSRVWWREGLEGEHLCWHMAQVHPDSRRQGIGRALLRWNEARLKEIARRHTAGARNSFRVWSQDTATGKNRLLEQEGYSIVRYFHFMQRKALHDLPAAPLPPEIRINPARPEHLRAIWDAKEEAFLDHWEYVPGGEADYLRFAEDPTHNLELWRIAWDGDQVIGTSIVSIFPEENAHYSLLRGIIWGLGVRRPWRGRGIARALLVESMRALHQQGMTEAVLGVDSENLSGALRLYKSVGFQTIGQDMTYGKPVETGADNR